MDYPTICQAHAFEWFKNLREKKICLKQNWGKKKDDKRWQKQNKKLAKTKSSPKYLNNLVKFGETSFAETSLGKTSFGEKSFGKTTFDETSFCETSFGEIQNWKNINFWEKLFSGTKMGKNSIVKFANLFTGQVFYWHTVTTKPRKYTHKWKYLSNIVYL